MKPVTVRWLTCGVCALMLHVVVLSWARASWRAESPAPTLQPVPPEPMQVRQIDAAKPDAPPAIVLDAAPASAEPAAPEVRPAAAPELAPTSHDDPQEPPSPGNPVDEAPVATSDDAPHYFERSALDRGPVVMSAVLLTYPEFPGDAGHYTVVLAIFIDEEGRVRRINIEEPGLPEALEGVARRAFLDARFQPAERGGRPVPSRIRVEVTFDSSPAP